MDTVLETRVTRLKEACMIIVNPSFVQFSQDPDHFDRIMDRVDNLQETPESHGKDT